MTITTTYQTIYRTADGSIFEDYDLAVKHELTQQVRKWANLHVSQRDIPQSWVEAAVKHRESLAEILNSVNPTVIVPPPTYAGDVRVTTHNCTQKVPVDLSLPLGPYVSPFDEGGVPT
jgi:hypothetical protein